MKRHIWAIVLGGLLARMAEAQDWQWAKQGSGAAWDYGWSVCTDGSGNVYSFGSYRSDPFNMDGSILHLSSPQTSGMYLAKYTSTGSQVWVRSFVGGGGGELIYDPGADAIFLAGWIGSSVTSFGGIPIDTHGGLDALVARFDLNGTCIWAKGIGGNQSDRFEAIALRPGGGILVTGRFASSAMFGTHSVQAGANLAAFDADGACLWAERKFAPDPSILTLEYKAAFLSLGAVGNKIYGFGNIYPLSLTIDGVDYEGNRNLQYFIACMDSVGGMEWMKPCGGYPYYLMFGDLELEDGYLYVTGGFEGDGYFDTDTLASPGDNTDMFLAKYDFEGTFEWAQQGNASVSGLGYDLEADGLGGVFLNGSVLGTGDLDGLPIISDSNGSSYIAHFGGAGNCQGFIQTQKGLPRRMALAPDNGVYVAGRLVGTEEFTSSLALTSGGEEDALLARTGPITTAIRSEQMDDQGALLIFANPNAGTCQIELPEQLLHERDLSLAIYSVDGRIVQRSRLKFEDGLVHLDIREEAKGVYRVEIGNGRVKRTGTIVFE